jgi:ankyrin repeat protein
VRILLDCDETDADAADAEGLTPLMHAVRWWHDDVVDEFLSHARRQVDVNRRDAGGRTALLWAASERRWDAVVRLLDAGKADAAVRDEFGQTVLAFAARSGPVHVARRLLSIDQVEPGATDICGLTPLMLASAFRNVEVEKLLRARLCAKTDIPTPDPQPEAPAAYPPSVKRIIHEVRALNFDLPAYVLPVHCVDGNPVSHDPVCTWRFACPPASAFQGRTSR